MTTTYFPEISERATGATVITGRVLSTIAVLFLTMDAIMKVLQVPQAIQGTARVGYSPAVILPLGIVQLVCLAFYLIPRTSVFGAILWTGYLGGAVATHVRVGDPLFTHILAPVYVATFLWAGLALRNPRLRQVLKG